MESSQLVFSRSPSHLRLAAASMRHEIRKLFPNIFRSVRMRDALDHGFNKVFPSTAQQPLLHTEADNVFFAAREATSIDSYICLSNSDAPALQSLALPLQGTRQGHAGSRRGRGAGWAHLGVSQLMKLSEQNVGLLGGDDCQRARGARRLQPA